MLKPGLEIVGKAANTLLGGKVVLQAYQEYQNADPEHEQEKFDDYMRAVGSLIFPFEGQVLMAIPEIVDATVTAAEGLYKCIKRKL